MCANTVRDDLRLTLYRLRTVERWPDSPQKTTLLAALQRRLDTLRKCDEWKGQQEQVR
jgi:hypothetical protein